MSNKDLSELKSLLDNIMQNVFDDKGIGFQAKGCIYKSCSDIRTEFIYKRILCNNNFTKE